MIQTVIEFMLLGIIGGFFGVFLRTCLSFEGMIFYKWYQLLNKWIEDAKSSPNILNNFKSFIAYPLGACIYCTTPWITILLCTIYLLAWEDLMCWQYIVIGYVTALGLQHWVVALAMKYLILDHPDLYEEDNEL